MRALVATIVTLALLSGPVRAAEPPIVTDDPRAYAEVFRDAMTLSGMRPLREAFGEMLSSGGGALPTDVEAAILGYERASLTTPAAVARIVEDLTLSDTFRVIYLYHYFGGNTWIFTRLDFVAIGDGQWALNRIAFSDRWANVVIEATPGFRPSARR